MNHIQRQAVNTIHESYLISQMKDRIILSLESRLYRNKKDKVTYVKGPLNAEAEVYFLIDLIEEI